MTQIDPNKKKQLDQNIKNMLANGASEEDVIKYSKDFHEKFSVKKKRIFTITISSAKIGFGTENWFFGYSRV